MDSSVQFQLEQQSIFKEDGYQNYLNGFQNRGKNGNKKNFKKQKTLVVRQSQNPNLNLNFMMQSGSYFQHQKFKVRLGQNQNDSVYNGNSGKNSDNQYNYSNQNFPTLNEINENLVQRKNEKKKSYFFKNQFNKESQMIKSSSMDISENKSKNQLKPVQNKIKLENKSFVTISESLEKSKQTIQNEKNMNQLQGQDVFEQPNFNSTKNIKKNIFFSNSPISSNKEANFNSQTKIQNKNKFSSSAKNIWSNFLSKGIISPEQSSGKTVYTFSKYNDLLIKKNQENLQKQSNYEENFKKNVSILAQSMQKKGGSTSSKQIYVNGSNNIEMEKSNFFKASQQYKQNLIKSKQSHKVQKNNNKNNNNSIKSKPMSECLGFDFSILTGINAKKNNYKKQNSGEKSKNKLYVHINQNFEKEVTPGNKSKEGKESIKMNSTKSLGNQGKQRRKNQQKIQENQNKLSSKVQSSSSSDSWNTSLIEEEEVSIEIESKEYLKLQQQKAEQLKKQEYERKLRNKSQIQTENMELDQNEDDSFIIKKMKQLKQKQNIFQNSSFIQRKKESFINQSLMPEDGLQNTQLLESNNLKNGTSFQNLSKNQAHTKIKSNQNISFSNLSQLQNNRKQSQSINFQNFQTMNNINLNELNIFNQNISQSEDQEEEDKQFEKNSLFDSQNQSLYFSSSTSISSSLSHSSYSNKPSYKSQEQQQKVSIQNQNQNKNIQDENQNDESKLKNKTKQHIKNNRQSKQQQYNENEFVLKQQKQSIDDIYMQNRYRGDTYIKLQRREAKQNSNFRKREGLMIGQGVSYSSLKEFYDNHFQQNMNKIQSSFYQDRYLIDEVLTTFYPLQKVIQQYMIVFRECFQKKPKLDDSFHIIQEEKFSQAIFKSFFEKLCLVLHSQQDQIKFRENFKGVAVGHIHKPLKDLKYFNGYQNIQKICISIMQELPNNILMIDDPHNAVQFKFFGCQGNKSQVLSTFGVKFSYQRTLSLFEKQQKNYNIKYICIKLQQFQ
ncbi:hypothetical protein PPERSA_03933 [Pseudocohnilembus persalinus]|uniref:Uncharacterized protein n=1 Tax=Pseudocohnilembus persalinus TaxID=266149 RepID=A0A0V0R5V2_PSEPJ|nr:hypothetical protein PPERSA_03933 [Pseudocohnilembus persalinus]|eukprot:KRX09871.1 hypothetical protein PPERSA_03933 [Pseudocohnilembus persalinus]